MELLKYECNIDVLTKEPLSCYRLSAWQYMNEHESHRKPKCVCTCARACVCAREACRLMCVCAHARRCMCGTGLLSLRPCLSLQKNLVTASVIIYNTLFNCIRLSYNSLNSIFFSCTIEVLFLHQVAIYLRFLK